MSMVDDTNIAEAHTLNGAGLESNESAVAPDVVAAKTMEVSPAPVIPEYAAVQDAPVSQPMTASASNSSQTPAQEEADGSAAAPYGTRSRNRTGGARPNYADDKDLDLEIEVAGRYQKSGAKPPRSPPEAEAATSTPEPMSGVVRTGFAAVNSNVPNGPVTAVPVKDTIPGTSTFSAQPSTGPAPSKKRKQPGTSTPLSNGTAAPTHHTKLRGGGSASSRMHLETNMMTFERSGARLNAKKELVADDGAVLKANNHAYFICEPPGEPYYLARIMEFLHANNDPEAPIDAVRVNWYYRPKDIQRRVQDTRVVFASMHSDTCPLTSLRGKCNIQHLSEIPNLDQYRMQKDSFWFDKLYDRYMHRYYEVIPTSKIINVPQHVKKVLDERWKFVLVEIGRGRELTSQVKTCKKCSLFAANQDSVDCAVCKNTYHMACINPPLTRKPARGFAWACAPCSRAQELRLEARNTPTLTDAAPTSEDGAHVDEEETSTSRDQMTRDSSVAPEPHAAPTAQQIAQANLWPYRYLGVHARVEDALDYDDRIYPRASSRLGPRHQANVNVWHGRPVELVKAADIKKKYVKSASHKKDAKLARETIAALEADKESKLTRPKWVIDEPLGYIARGGDEPLEIKGKKEYTAQLTFKMPDAPESPGRGQDHHDLPDNREDLVDNYMKQVALIAPQYGLEASSVDFLNKAVEKFQEHHYDAEKALSAMRTLHPRSDLKQPELNREEVKRFEEGVSKYGSELHSVARHIGANFKEARVVRFYYMWKKTERGKQIWGNYEGRKSKKESKRLEKDGTASKLLDDLADDHDDSAFDNDKAVEKKRGFECKFCATRYSRQWRRAPGTPPGTLVPRDAVSKNSKDKSNWLTLALCGKCAYLWRRYAIQYESIEEVSKKIAAAGGRASKRKIDEELMRTIVEAQHESGDTITASTAAVAASAGVEVPATIIQVQEPPKKKAKADKEGPVLDVLPPERKKVIPDKPPEPAPLVPEPPRIKLHPCAICKVFDVPGDELLKCRDCRLHVHRSCYGVSPERNTKSWFCDMCSNDHNTLVSTTYECVLCPVTYTHQDLMEQPKVSHKKKTDREREKERLEREMIQESVRRWRHDQEGAGRPVQPREPLKRTAWNNWVHVACALWTKEIKFGNAELLDEAEGVGFIPRERFEAKCKICNETGFPTVPCHLSNCNANFHIGCAHRENYVFGFDIAVVKGTRRDIPNVIKLEQETGVATAAIWCPHHAIPSIVHSMLEPTEEGITAMQLFARTCKQVDTSITGTVRRAQQFSYNPTTAMASSNAPARRTVTANGAPAVSNAPVERVAGRNRSDSVTLSPRSAEELFQDPTDTDLALVRLTLNSSSKRKRCCNCLVEFSPKWYEVRRPIRRSTAHQPTTGMNGMPATSDESLPVRDVAAADSIERVMAAEPVTNVVRDGSAFTRSPVLNGIKPELSPQLSSTPQLLKGQSEETVYQCHKCHVKCLTPPSESPKVRPRSTVKSPDRPTALAQEPIFYQTPHPFGAHHYMSRPYVDGPAHSHPPGPPPPHVQHMPWPPNVPGPHPGPHTAWSQPMRNGAPPPPSNAMPPGAPYHPHPNGPPQYTDPYQHRPSYPSPYANYPPPSRSQSNNGPAPGPSLPSSTTYGLPGQPHHGGYPTSPRGYGAPPPESANATPTPTHGGQPPVYAPPVYAPPPDSTNAAPTSTHGREAPVYAPPPFYQDQRFGAGQAQRRQSVGANGSPPLTYINSGRPPSRTYGPPPPGVDQTTQDHNQGGPSARHTVDHANGAPSPGTPKAGEQPVSTLPSGNKAGESPNSLRKLLN